MHDYVAPPDNVFTLQKGEQGHHVRLVQAPAHYGSNYGSHVAHGDKQQRSREQQRVDTGTARCRPPD